MVICAKGIEAIELAPAPAKQPKSTLVGDEFAQFWGVIGAIGWLARQLCADLAFGYSWLAQRKDEAA
eukprot:5927490-Prorocentrum_lima.AAC.1